MSSYYSTESIEHKVNIGEMPDPLETEAIEEAYLDFLEWEAAQVVEQTPHIDDY